MYQQLTIVGNLGRDPEMRYTPSGVPVTEFPVAVNRVTKRQDGTRSEETTWYTVTCWRGLAETTYKYLKQGRQVMVVSDRIESDAWVDKGSGEARSKLKVTASDVRFLSGGDTHDEPTNAELEGRNERGGEDLPF